MESNQIKLLNSLANRIRAKKRSNKAVVASLQSAKILTKSKNFTGTYSNLNSIVSSK